MILISLLQMFIIQIKELESKLVMQGESLGFQSLEKKVSIKHFMLYMNKHLTATP